MLAEGGTRETQNKLMKLYRVIMTTQNPSEDRMGLFSTKEKARKEVEKYEEIVSSGSMKEHWGETSLVIEEEILSIDVGID